MGKLKLVPNIPLIATNTMDMDSVPTLLYPVVLILKFIEKLLFVLIQLYDAYCYSPLQTCLSPVVAKIPRTVTVGGHSYTVFTANIVSWSRTALVIPIAVCLKYDYNTTAFLLVLFHDFLDHLDGIVAKVQKTIYGPVDDPILGGFMDAFCDKIVNVLSLWSILMVADFIHMSSKQSWLFFGSCSAIIAYEFVLGIVRVQDYFQAYYSRQYGDTTTSSSPNIAAVMEGKLKEKLESLGIGCLCLAQASTIPLESIAGVTGVVCLLLSIRLAHASLEHKLKARRLKGETGKPKNIAGYSLKSLATERTDVIKDESGKDTNSEKELSFSGTEDNLSDEEKSDECERERAGRIANDISRQREAKLARKKIMLHRRHSYGAWSRSLKKVDKVYTVGCFDLFHEGHVKLFERLRTLGKQLGRAVNPNRSTALMANSVKPHYPIER